MSPQPRKARSGRRQFPGGMHGGTNQEWKQVMAHPDVQRALNDPGIQQALYQNLQSTVPGGMGSLIPPSVSPSGPPAPMADGGSVDSTLSPEQAAERTAGARSPAQVAQLQQLGFNPDTDSPGGRRPVRFQSGGLSLDEQEQILKEKLATATPQEQAAIQTKLSRIQQAKMTSQQAPSGPVTLPGGGTASASTMSGLNQMVNPPSTGNTAAAMGVGALMGLGTTRQQGLSALVGAGTAGLLNYFIRKYGKGAQQSQKTTPQQTQSSSQADRGQTTTNQEPNLQGPAGQATTPNAPAAPSPPTAPNSGATEVQSAQAWNPGWRNQPDSTAAQPSVAIATGADTPSPGGSGTGQGIMMGSANSTSGSVISKDGGKTWMDQQTGQPYQGGPVVNQSQITPSSSLMDATPQTTPPAVPQDDLGIASHLRDQGASAGMIDRANEGEYVALDEPALMGDEDFDFAKGGRVRKRKLAEGGLPVMPKTGRKAVLLRKPAGMPIPVLHTTIVIAAKPRGKKAEAKSMGGHLPQEERRPRKPNAIPPVAGPGDGGRPRPHGRVQVPRGSGAAIRGKRFGGIY